LTYQGLADQLGVPLKFVKRNEHTREMRLVDFLTLMHGLGRHPIFSLRELANEIERALS